MIASSQILDAALLQRIGWTLVHFLWQGALIAAGLWVTLQLLRRRQPAVRYLVACAAMLLMAVAPALTFVVVRPAATNQSASPATAVAGSGAKLVPTSLPETDPPPADASRLGGGDAPSESPANALAGTRQPRSTDASGGPTDALAGTRQPGATSQPASPANALAGSVPTSGPGDPHERAAASAQPPPQPSAGRHDDSWQALLFAKLESALPFAAVAWLIGVIACSIWHLLAWLRIQRLRRTAEPLDDREPGSVWQAAADRLTRLFRLSRPVRLLQSARQVGPIVFGVLRPVVLIPASLLSGLTPVQVEAILAHELAHVRRHDYLVNLIQAVIETVLFYHPAVWWVSGRIRSERENCCDDLAIEALSRTGDSELGHDSKPTSKPSHCHGWDVVRDSGVDSVTPDAQARQVYATALADLAELSVAHSGPRQSLFARLAPGKRIAPGVKMNLLARIRRIIGLPTTEGPRRATWLAGGLILAAMLAAIPIACQPTKTTPPPSPADALAGPVTGGTAVAASQPATQANEYTLELLQDVAWGFRDSPAELIERNADGSMLISIQPKPYLTEWGCTTVTDGEREWAEQYTVISFSLDKHSYHVMANDHRGFPFLTTAATKAAAGRPFRFLVKPISLPVDIKEAGLCVLLVAWDPQRKLVFNGLNQLDAGATTQPAVDPKTTVLTKGQPLGEAIELLHLAKVKDLTAEIKIQSRDDFPSRWYELADGACLELVASRNNPQRQWRVADICVGPPGKRPATENEWLYELKRQRWAFNVADAKFDARQLRVAATQAEIVFVGKVVKANLKETFWSGHMMSFREATYEVKRKLKGDVPEQVTVHFLILGDGENGDYTYLNGHQPQLNPKVFAEGAEHVVCASLQLSKTVLVAPGQVRMEHGPDDKFVVLYMAPSAADAEPVVRPVLVTPAPATQGDAVPEADLKELGKFLTIREQGATLAELVARAKPDFTFGEGGRDFMWVTKDDPKDPSFRLERAYTYQPAGQPMRFVLLKSSFQGGPRDEPSGFLEGTGPSVVAPLSSEKPMHDGGSGDYAFVKWRGPDGAVLYEIGWQTEFGSNWAKGRRLYVLHAGGRWQFVGEGSEEGYDKLGWGQAAEKTADARVEWTGKADTPVRIRFAAKEIMHEWASSDDLQADPHAGDNLRDDLEESFDFVLEGKLPATIRKVSDRPFMLAREGETLDKLVRHLSAWTTAWRENHPGDRARTEATWRRELLRLNPKLPAGDIPKDTRIDLPTDKEEMGLFPVNIPAPAVTSRPATQADTDDSDERGAASVAVPGGVLRVFRYEDKHVENGKTSIEIGWRCGFTPDGGKERVLGDFSAMSSGVKLWVAPNGKYLAVLSYCEGVDALDVIDLPLLLAKGEFKSLVSAGSWPNSITMKKWDGPVLLVESYSLLTFQSKDETLEIMFSDPQTFTADPRTGKLTPITAGAKDPVAYFTRQLRAKDSDDGEKHYNAIIALRQLKAVAALPDLRKALTATTRPEEKETIQQTIDALTAPDGKATTQAEDDATRFFGRVYAVSAENDAKLAGLSVAGLADEIFLRSNRGEVIPPVHPVLPQDSRAACGSRGAGQSDHRDHLRLRGGHAAGQAALHQAPAVLPARLAVHSDARCPCRPSTVARSPRAEPVLQVDLGPRLLRRAGTDEVPRSTRPAGGRPAPDPGIPESLRGQPAPAGNPRRPGADHRQAIAPAR